MKENKSIKDEIPYIKDEENYPETTKTSLGLGILLAVIFGAANAYLGLRVGMTVSASIPAAVISMGVIRVLLKRESILENNMVQTIGSAGESVAAGAIFTLPTLFLWASEWGDNPPSLLRITSIALCGGILGVLFMVPLRKALIVKEHKTLPYPEGTACAQVLKAGEQGASKAGIVFSGLFISAVYKFIADGFKIIKSELHLEFPRFGRGALGIDVLPALVGVGYICKIKIATYMLTGGVLSWLVLMPLIGVFGGETIFYPGTVPILQMDSWALWSNYIKYIGAGCVAMGGILSLIKSFPLIVTTFMASIKDFKGNQGEKEVTRTENDLPMKTIVLAIVVVAIVMWLLPFVPVNFWGALLIIIFGFFFATVSSRLVGLVGSSNNPVSGMTIATLLVASLLLKVTGNDDAQGMIGAISIGSVICMIAAVAGDTSQDLKTGYILGATPKRQQIGELIGITVSALTIGGVLYLLDRAWGFGSEQLAAPQATLMKMIVEGVMGGNLPWTLVIIGAFIAVIVELLHIPVLPFAVGLYLPIHLSVGIMAGAVVRHHMEYKNRESEKKEGVIENGILYTSGLIAGEGLVGILLAICALIPISGKSLSDILDLSKHIQYKGALSILAFALLIMSIYYNCENQKKKSV